MADLLDLTGVDGLQRYFQQLQAEVLPLAAIALVQEADASMEQSKALVPVDTGSLRQSGKTDQPQLTPTTAEVTMRYGGTEGIGGRIPENYAIRIHEDVTLNHPRGGQSHYLSAPLFAATQGMLERIGEQLRNAL